MSGSVQVGSAKIAGGNELAVVLVPDRGVVPVADLVPGFDGDLLALLGQSSLTTLADVAAAAPARVFRDPAEFAFTAPYRHPRKLWGIGLNYLEQPATCPRTCRPSRPRS